MSFLQRLGRFVTGGIDATKDATAVLRDTYADAVRRLQLVERHAVLAPQDYSRKGLELVAESARRQVEVVRAELRRRSAELPLELAADTAPAAATNHWGRLLQDLELHRGAAQRLRELAFHFAEVDADLSKVLEELCQENLRSCERLRELIARADPQALD